MEAALARFVAARPHAGTSRCHQAATTTRWHQAATQPAVPRRRLAGPRASAPGGGGEEKSGELSVSQFAEQLMNDPENQSRMQRVTEAAQRVAELQAESDRLAAAMAAAAAAEAASAQERERRAAEAAAKLIADAEVAAAEKLLQAAQLQAEQAAAAKRKWAFDIDEDAERLESAKAGAVAGLGGLAAALPLALADGSSGTGAALLGVATAGLASALLGVTYRYAVRQDVANTQLKAGVVAAFGLVRGLGQASGILSSSAEGSVAGLDLSTAALGGAGLALGQCMLAAAFAATAVEAAFQQGFVKPFGSGGSDAGSS